MISSTHLIGLCVALGVGLMIGAERERRKGEGPTRSAAGIRTFAIAALTGAVAMLLGGVVVLSVSVLFVGALALLAYQRSARDDPGITTEVALVLTALLGGLAIENAALAAGVGVTLAILLAARDRIHFFVRGVLTEQELHDALVFAAAVLIVLPLAPDRYLGPFNAINPHALVLLIVLVMAINAAGYIATRLLGARFGLPIAGFVGGFVSSTATIHAMGTRIREASASTGESAPQALVQGATAGAVLSSIATLVQMMLVLIVIQRDLAMSLALPMLLGSIAATVYSLGFVRTAVASADTVATETSAREQSGRAFNPVSAIGFACTVGAMLVIVAALNHWLGQSGVLLSAALGGFVDAHAAAASVATLVTREGLPLSTAANAVMIGITTNALMKAFVAYQSAGVRYAARIAPGLMLMVAVVWLATFL